MLSCKSHCLLLFQPLAVFAMGSMFLSFRGSDSMKGDRGGLRTRNRSGGSWVLWFGFDAAAAADAAVVQ